MTEKAKRELVDRNFLTNKIQRWEHRNSNPTLKQFSTGDNHPQTKEENELLQDWVKKINGNYKETLTCGDRVYYIDHLTTKGSKRWRTGIILQRKKDYEYFNGIKREHGYDIYDIENCTTVSRTRQDIRKYKHTKVEWKLLEKANKHLAKMRREFMKNENFKDPRMEKPIELENRITAPLAIIHPSHK